MRAVSLLLIPLALAGACGRADGPAGDDAGTPVPDAGDPGTDTDTGLPFTGWDACVYVFTGWYTKADQCWGDEHATSTLIQFAEDFCADNWEELCDLDAPSDPELAYDCRFAIKLATCEEWEAGVWFEDAACVELTAGIDCDFPSE